MPDDFKVQIAEVDPCRRAATATSFGLSFSDVAKDLKMHSYKWMKAVNNAPTNPESHPTHTASNVLHEPVQAAPRYANATEKRKGNFTGITRERYKSTRIYVHGRFRRRHGECRNACSDLATRRQPIARCIGGRSQHHFQPSIFVQSVCECHKEAFVISVRRPI